MASFEGSKKILLYEGDTNVSFDFQFTVCSSSTANDGFIAFGLDATSVNIYGYAEDDSAATGLVGPYSLSNNIVTVALSYPTEGAGSYKLYFKLGLSDGSIVWARFDRVFCEDL
jgi:hypothetical protein